LQLSSYFNNETVTVVGYLRDIGARTKSPPALRHNQA